MLTLASRLVYVRAELPTHIARWALVPKFSFYFTQTQHPVARPHTTNRFHAQHTTTHCGSRAGMPEA
jgi:hypothetical protein